MPCKLLSVNMMRNFGYFVLTSLTYTSSKGIASFLEVFCVSSPGKVKSFIMRYGTYLDRECISLGLRHMPGNFIHVDVRGSNKSKLPIC